MDLINNRGFIVWEKYKICEKYNKNRNITTVSMRLFSCSAIFSPNTAEYSTNLL